MTEEINAGSKCGRTPAPICGDRRNGNIDFSTGELLPRLREHQDPEKRRPLPPSDRRSIVHMTEEIEKLKQSRCVYLLVGALVGFGGTLIAVALALIP
ncbi:hypothetical protein MMC2321_01919 [Chitinophaga sp. MM2321]